MTILTLVLAVIVEVVNECSTLKGFATWNFHLVKPFFMYLQISLYYFPRNTVILQNFPDSNKKGQLVHLYDEMTFHHYFVLRSFAYSAAAVNTMSEEEFNAVSHES